jgi:hypothetical protein
MLTCSAWTLWRDRRYPLPYSPALCLTGARRHSFPIELEYAVLQFLLMIPAGYSLEIWLPASKAAF